MKQNPQRFYRAPYDVVRDRRFSDAERLEILGAWEEVAETGSEEARQAMEARKEIERKLAESDTSADAKR